MAATTAPPVRAPRVKPALVRARSSLASWARQGVTVVSAARARYRRPALTTSGFACIDAAAWHTYGTGAGLLVLGVLVLVFEWLGGEDT